MTTHDSPPQPSAPDGPTNGLAEIYDRGYRIYDGPRTGVFGAMRAVGVATIQRSLGMRRKFRFKIVPILVIFIAYVPALVFMGLAVLLPAEIAGEVVAEYGGYFGLIAITMILLTAFVVPEVMGSDRRTGMFGLYLASPLNRWNYLGSKFASIMIVTSLVTLFPVLFLMIGYTFVEIGPDGFGDGVEVVLSIFASGLVLSIFFSLFGMAVSTLTDRPLFASAAIVMVTIASEAFSAIIADNTDAPEWVRLFGVIALPLQLISRIWVRRDESELDVIPDVSDAVVAGTWVAVVAGFAAVLLIGYRRLEVTK